MISIRFCGNLGPPSGIWPGAFSGLEIRSINPLFITASFTLSYVVSDIGAPLAGTVPWQTIQLLSMIDLTFALYDTFSTGVMSIRSDVLLSEHAINKNAKMSGAIF